MLLKNPLFEAIPFLFLHEFNNSTILNIKEKKMIYDFFTDPEEVEKLNQQKLITTEVKNKLLNPP